MGNVPATHSVEHDVRPPCAASIVSAAILAFAMASSCSAMTRVESMPVGIPGSGKGLGSAVAIYGDTAAVGAPYAQPAPFVGSGSVDVYRQVGAAWQSEAVLLPADGTFGMRFGTSVALGTDVLVATTMPQPDGSATVYTFEHTGSSWEQVDHFTGSGSVSLSGDTLALGNGAIYVRAGTGWSAQAQLAAEEGETFKSTIVDGDFALAWSSAYNNSGFFHNYAYVFRRDGGAWTREARIELGESSDFETVIPPLALSERTALISWRNVVTAYVRGSDGAWSTQGVFDPLTSAPGFGAAIALDGDRALASSPGDTVYGWLGAGTVYVFERSGGIWSRVAHVAHPAINYGNYGFGTAVALDGSSMLVGAPGAYTEAGLMGDATVLAESSGDWTPVAVLDAGNDHRAEEFGGAVALSGSTLLVGAPNATTDVPIVFGAAYVFDAVNGAWIERVRLAPSPPYGYGFGSAVALDQDTAVVGVPRVVGSDVDPAGAVYVFLRGDGSWPQQARLTGGSTEPVAFGSAVAVEGDVLAAGAPGSSNAPGHGVVHVFGRSGSIWSPQAVVEASDGADKDRFGSAMALDGDRLVVGAPNADVGIETGAGAVYLFTSVGGVWSQQAKVVAPVATKLGGFGTSVALAGDTLVVGAVDATATRGAAYVYSLSGGAVTFQTRLIPASGTAVSGRYGSSVAISESADRIVVGQPYGTSASPNGRAFVFNLAGPGWSPGTELTGTAAPQIDGDGFGTSMAMSNETVVVGAPADGRGGAAYLADIGDVIFVNGFETN